MREWVPLRDEYLAEFLRLDGPGDFDIGKCSRCAVQFTSADPLVFPTRCEDCFSGLIRCSNCCVTDHTRHPLHAIQKWNGQFFEKTTLRDLGLCVQLGHVPGSSCLSPEPGPAEFTVVHTNGIHVINLNYCGCGSAGNKRQQLLRREWFPASQVIPQTCCTFRVLESFQITSLQLKISAYDFYGALAKLTDNTGLDDMKDRYRVFGRLVRQFLHIIMLKRGGRGHAATGAAGTSSGELAVMCPACPRPGVNLPTAWKDVDEDKRFLYTQVVTIDACFRLKRRDVSSRAKDPGLGTGWAYFVEDEPYREHLLKYTDQQEMSTCVGLAALDHANTKFSAGLESTGVGAIQCRHEMQLPNGVGDLQKGERYANMDYIFASAMRHFREGRKLGPTVVSYDICCQWSKNLFDRLRRLPDDMFFEVEIDGIRYAIPKFHILAHLLKCQLNYSLNLMRGVGRTDGENIERGWSKIDAAAGSTKEMGPGSCHDTLNNHWGFTNWLVYIGFGKTLRRKLINAVVELKEQKDSFVDFSDRVEEKDLARWAALVKAWDEDSNAPNPYEPATSGLTEAAARLQITQEESRRIAQRNSTSRNVTTSAFLIEGLAIEDQQAQLRADIKSLGNTPTDSQGLTIVERKTALFTRIARFRRIQAQHMVMPPTDDSEEDLSGCVQDIELGLPSSLTGDQTGLLRSADLINAEDRLREAQCYEALEKLRHHLYLRTGLVSYRRRNVRHQGAATRARGFVDRNEAKVQLFAEKYRPLHRAARLNLIGPGGWEEDLQVLHRDDIRVMNASAATADQPPTRASTLGEGHRHVSWIWKAAVSAAGESNGMNEALRVEWSKAKARVDRWSEEVDLLREEMRRVQATLRHRAGWWENKANNCEHLDGKTLVGAIAYARSQESLQHCLSARFTDLWRGLQDSSRDEEIARTFSKLRRSTRETARDEAGDQ
ncbi:hypothetical protein BD410DRAFT_725441 [Rickenella mellea]|uniref:CxC2-like cysteine cluster KDZ transposase-associated domain-containing protein n=1 Tax=Rickenella mellea TaxID=50990 RepID=A0A4Y7PZS0_9AGAM|nr:hypothetical protein BD410DRAFT_725441 [Rickenella mellea]